MDFGGVGDIRDILLSLPLTHVMFSVFVTACATGALCTLVCSVIRAAPVAVRDMLAWHAMRKCPSNGKEAWIEGHARLPRRD